MITMAAPWYMFWKPSVWISICSSLALMNSREDMELKSYHNESRRKKKTEKEKKRTANINSVTINLVNNGITQLKIKPKLAHKSYPANLEIKKLILTRQWNKTYKKN